VGEGLRRLFPETDRAEEVLNSVTYALGLCLDPRVYPLLRQTPDGSVMIYKSRATKAFEPFVVLFRFDGVQVFLDDIWGAIPDVEN
jgi:hypothetical protein